MEADGDGNQARLDIDDVLKEAILVEKSGSYWSRFTAGNTLDGEGDYSLTSTPDPAVLKMHRTRCSKKRPLNRSSLPLKSRQGRRIHSQYRKAGYVVNAASPENGEAAFRRAGFTVVPITAKKTELKNVGGRTAQEYGADGVVYDQLQQLNRMYNIEKGAKMISGTVVEPGEIFDTNVPCSGH